MYPLQFPFNIILYLFQMYSKVVRKSWTLQSASPFASRTLLPLHTYRDIINYITYAIIYISGTIRYLPICTI